MFGIDEGADAALLLGLGQAVQRQRGLARRFRPIDFDDAAARQAADAERDIEAERTGGDNVDVHRLVVFAEPHDRALAKAALDLGERRIKGFRFVHGRSFNETKRCTCTHVPCSLWPGFGRPATKRPLPGNAKTALYTICSMFAICSFRGCGIHIPSGQVAMSRGYSMPTPTSPSGLRKRCACDGLSKVRSAFSATSYSSYLSFHDFWNGFLNCESFA